MDAAIDQRLQDLIPILLATTSGLLVICLHRRSPKKVSQVTISERIEVPPIAFIHTIIDVGGRRVGASDDGVASTRIGSLDIAGDGVTRTPVTGARGHLSRGYIEVTLWFLNQFIQPVSRGYMLGSFTMYPPL